MPSRRAKEDVALAELYARVPEVECQGLCTDACGPIDAGPRERERILAAGVHIPGRVEALSEMVSKPEGYQCPALAGGRCSVYETRPMICRVWGASLDLICPYGCRPTGRKRLLKPAEAYALLDAASKVGTDKTPLPVEFFETALKDPLVRQAVRSMISRRRPSRRRPV